MTTLVQRVAWNTFGWRMPSGDAEEAGFYSDEGFGHEEWNLATHDAVADHVLGYTYQRPSNRRHKNPEEVYRIVFFTVDPLTKHRVVCGMYHRAKLMNDGDTRIAFQEFARRGVFERRARELVAAVPSMTIEHARSEMRKAITERWLKWRCPISSVQTFEVMPKLEDLVGKRTVGNYFSSFTYLDRFPRATQRLSRVAEGMRRKLLEDSYYRNVKVSAKRIERRHSILSNGLSDWLKRTGLHPIQESDRIDVQFKFQDSLVLCELKVCCGNTRQAIRAALGQLLEYSYYPPRSAPGMGLIVLDEKPSDADVKFVRRIKRELNLPIYLGYQDAKDFNFFAVGFDRRGRTDG